MRPSTLPRERIPWFPTVDTERCVGDQVCVEFCKNDVYRWDEEHAHPIVANPYHCVLGCNACMELCPVQAISFPAPQELREMIRRLRTEPRAEPVSLVAPQAPGG